jgi:predicted O-methyltransferase YrrM
MKPISQEFELLKPTKSENAVLQKLDPAYLEASEMTIQERQFLNALVLRHKPQKCLELGVSAGSSSVIILNALKNRPAATLHAIDYVKQYYLDSHQETGYIARQYTNLTPQWSLYTGGLAAEFLDTIGPDIDFCFIDTVHMNPGELFDTLMVLPYLKDDAILAYHDVNLHSFRPKVNYNIQKASTNNLLMSAVHGHKIVQGDFSWAHDKRTAFPNIGAVHLTKATKTHAFEIFNLLAIPWQYLPSTKDEKVIISHLTQHYGSYEIEYLKRVFNWQRQTPSYEQNLSAPTLGKMALKKLLNRTSGR